MIIKPGTLMSPPKHRGYDPAGAGYLPNVGPFISQAATPVGSVSPIGFGGGNSLGTGSVSSPLKYSTVTPTGINNTASNYCFALWCDFLDLSYSTLGNNNDTVFDLSGGAGADSFSSSPGYGGYGLSGGGGGALCIMGDSNFYSGGAPGSNGGNGDPGQAPDGYSGGSGGTGYAGANGTNLGFPIPAWHTPTIPSGGYGGSATPSNDSAAAGGGAGGGVCYIVANKIRNDYINGYVYYLRNAGGAGGNGSFGNGSSGNAGSDGPPIYVYARNYNGCLRCDNGHIFKIMPDNSVVEMSFTDSWDESIYTTWPTFAGGDLTINSYTVLDANTIYDYRDVTINSTVEVSGDAWLKFGCRNLTINGTIAPAGSGITPGTYSETAPDGTSLSASPSNGMAGDGGSTPGAFGTGGTGTNGLGGGGAGYQSGETPGYPFSAGGAGGTGVKNSMGTQGGIGGTLPGGTGGSGDPLSDDQNQDLFGNGGGGGGRGRMPFLGYFRVRGTLAGSGAIDCSGDAGGPGGAGGSATYNTGYTGNMVVGGSGGGGGGGGDGGYLMIHYGGSNASSITTDVTAGTGGAGGVAGAAINGGGSPGSAQDGNAGGSGGSGVDGTVDISFVAN